MTAAIVLFILLGAAFILDAFQSKIPNYLTATGMLAGLLLSCVAGEGGWPADLLRSAAGLAVGLSIMLVLYGVGAVGAGDVKLFGAIGAITGAPFVLYGAMNSILCAALVGMGWLLWRREWRQRVGIVCGVLFRFWIWREWKSLRSSEWGARAEPLRFPFMFAVLPGVGLTCWTMGTSF